MQLVTFCVSRYKDDAKRIVVTRVCVSVCLSEAACPHYCTDPDITWGSGRGCPLVVYYWTDLQSVHWLCCYGNIMRTRNVSEYMLVLALCLVGRSYRFLKSIQTDFLPSFDLRFNDHVVCVFLVGPCRRLSADGNEYFLNQCRTRPQGDAVGTGTNRRR